ncbi:hypothetical protein [Ralstonia solanacearum]|uniref:hypothetical protein n=1 Tax=Ralstonia solanacearum TaxID=305 RepID=UPI000AF4C5F3|nr:hypothetical protein [Ralstonia solanacearum]
MVWVHFWLGIPDTRKNLGERALQPKENPGWKEWPEELVGPGARQEISRETPWNQLNEAQRPWGIHREPRWKPRRWNKQWYRVGRFFHYLESKGDQKDIRVVVVQYRNYSPWQNWRGARLKNQSMVWRLGTPRNPQAVVPPAERFLARGVTWRPQQLETLARLKVDQLLVVAIARIPRFFHELKLPSALVQEAIQLLLGQVATPLA